MALTLKKFSHKLCFSYPYFFATHCCWPKIFWTKNSVRSNNQILKYQKFKPSGYKNIGLRKCNLIGRYRLYNIFECSIVEKNFSIHLIPWRYFYAVLFLNISVGRKVVCDISPVVLVKRRNVFLQILINMDKTWNNTILQTSCMYTGCIVACIQVV